MTVVFLLLLQLLQRAAMSGQVADTEQGYMPKFVSKAMDTEKPPR